MADRFEQLIDAALCAAVDACVAGDDQAQRLAQANVILAQVARGYEQRMRAAETTLAEIDALVASAAAAEAN